ncbi:anthrax toxin lethal factor-related metalloendopeptidase [Cytobacillus praedii]|uniref:anthrax toxin lethal factor-related metalloendopeptidase n=1 Tax=Cytobacillus praedii TaxID=1742358 RepID=UPI003AF672AA
MKNILLKGKRAFSTLLLTTILTFSFSTAALGESGSTQSLKMNHVLERVVVVETKGDYDQEEALNMVNRIWSIPTSILNVMYKQGVQVKFINFPLTDLPEYAYLKGEVPRGWEHTPYTWDDVPGIGGQTVVARIGYSYKKMHSSVNLELHETAHAIDNYVFNNISYSDEFTKIHTLEHDDFNDNPYYDYKEEYFAEAFAYFYASSDTNEELKEKAPLTFKFINELQQNIPSEKHSNK